MNKNLLRIAKSVLTFEEAGLSKVRFAKTLYFVHKDLIRKGNLLTEDIAYVRMPLGPVPLGFMELDLESSILISARDTGQLPYDALVYSLREKYEVPVDAKETIRATLERLNNFSTSQLVEISHRDPSWIEHLNSQQYYITDRDLKNDLPKKTSSKLDSDEEKQNMQANLVSGMIDDIVEESTALEHPSE